MYLDQQILSEGKPLRPITIDFEQYFSSSSSKCVFDPEVGLKLVNKIVDYQGNV